MKNKKFVLAVLLISISFSSSTYANSIDTPILTEINSSKLPPVYYFDALGNFSEDYSSSSLEVYELERNLNEVLNLSDDHTLELLSSITDELGITHDTYKHYFKGIAVDHEMVIVHSKEGIVNTMNGQISVFEGLSNTSAISDEEAISIVKRDFENEEAVVVSLEEVYSAVLKRERSQVYLVKKIDVRHPGQIKSTTYFVDAITGKIVNEIENNRQAHVVGQGTTFYRGTKSINVDSQGSTFRLYDHQRKINTLNASSATVNDFTLAVSNATQYTSTSSTFDQTAIRPAVDIHWGIGKTYDFYAEKFSHYGFQKSTSSSTNTALSINLYYNFQSLGEQGIFNAGAVGHPTIPEQSFMIFGRGGNYQGMTFSPFVALDVTGHEYSHLVIEFNGRGGLVYQNESGSLNEAIADIFGVSVDFYNNENPNWLMGEEIVPSVVGNLRNLQFPKQSVGGGQQPDTYQGEYWETIPALMNHTNSGVGNRWFYLLSMGGSGTNDVSNPYAVTGITIEKAQAIVYRALMNYLIPHSTFLQARAATENAARDLYGNNSPEVNAVSNAWYAVNVGTTPANINEEKLEQSISVYPNPATDSYINIDSSLSENTEVELYDVVGKLIKKNIKIFTGNNIYDISGLQSGIYLLRFNTESTSYSKKLIIK